MFTFNCFLRLGAAGATRINATESKLSVWCKIQKKYMAIDNLSAMFYGKGDLRLVSWVALI
jgi:hypothetical protein